MRDLSMLSPNDTHLFFDAQRGHIPVSMSRLPEARVVWVNQRAMGDDPAFAACGGTLAAYRAHLLCACAYAISPDGEGGATPLLAWPIATAAQGLVTTAAAAVRPL